MNAEQGGQRKGRLRKSLDWVRERARRLRDRFRKPEEPEEVPPPEDEEEGEDHDGPPDLPPPQDRIVGLRVRVIFITSTDQKPDPRTGEVREVEWTLQVLLSFVLKLRALMRARRYAEAMQMLDPEFNDQYMTAGIITEIIEILKPRAWAGAEYMLTPTDVITYRNRDE
ncbi:hypothetical protein [Mycobacteroides abscessus]|uniref:hypothetical protein n=1 Tax=Mycobacteroides abscessus TaxID=36809 RepID=UPI0012FFE4A4|nr:hypothetical protein [Mycobacteroides abscessus]